MLHRLYEAPASVSIVITTQSIPTELLTPAQFIAFGPWRNWHTQLPQEQPFYGFNSHRAYQKFCRSLKIQRRVGRTVRHLSAKQGSRKRLTGSTPVLSAIAEGTAEWPATGPENRGIVMSDGRSIRLPFAKLAQVRESGRNGPAVTRFPPVGRGGSNPPLCTRVPACANWNSSLS